MQVSARVGDLTIKNDNGTIPEDGVMYTGGFDLPDNVSASEGHVTSLLDSHNLTFFANAASPTMRPDDAPSSLKLASTTVSPRKFAEDLVRGDGESCRVTSISLPDSWL
jgi:hypothetical protein